MKETTNRSWHKKLLENKPTLLAALLVLVVGGTAAILIAPSPTPQQDALLGPVTYVQRGPLTISITESGTIRPREQVILKNELDDPAAILFIVEEGALVKKGDLVIELDATALENDRVERKIRVQNDEADLIFAQENMKVVQNQAESDIQQAELDYRFAKQDLHQYIEGEYPKLLKEAESKITLVQEELGQAKEDLKWSQILYEEKYLAQSELQKHELATKKHELNLELANADLELLRSYTYQRQVDQLESDVEQTKMALERTKRLAAANIAQAKAELAAREAELLEESERLAEIERLISRAKMYAPISGTVLYATSVGNRWRRDDDVIEAGTIIRERDEIVYLPTASEFNVNVNIPEVDLGKIQTGLPVAVNVDAIPGRTLRGKVKSISQLPDSDSRYMNPNLKLYETVIELDLTEAQVRNGMSCQAEILVEKYENVLYVPLQSVVKVQGKTVVYQVDDLGKVIPREVQLGLDNSRFVHIQSGLEEGDSILLAPPLRSGEDGQDSEPETSSFDNEPAMDAAPEEEPIQETSLPVGQGT